MADTQKSGVIHFYDMHPINEDEILAKLAAQGMNLDTLTEDELKDFDQDRYGSIEVADILAERAGIRRTHHVLDVCSGMGGPARWLAHRIGCHVTGLDVAKSRVDSAQRFNQRVRLVHLVDFVQGDAVAVRPSSTARLRVRWSRLLCQWQSFVLCLSKVSSQVFAPRFAHPRAFPRQKTPQKSCKSKWTRRPASRRESNKFSRTSWLG